MIGRWFRSLQGRLTLIIFLAILIAQFISLTLIVPIRQNQEYIGRERIFFREALSAVDLFLSDPNIRRDRYAIEAGSRGSFFWMAPNSSISVGTAMKTKDLPETARALGRLQGLEVRVRLHDDPRSLIRRYLPSPPPPEQSGQLLPLPPGFAESFENQENGSPRVLPPQRLEMINNRPLPPLSAQDGRPPPRPPNGMLPPRRGGPVGQGDAVGEWGLGPITPPNLDGGILWNMPGMPQTQDAPVMWRLAIQMPDGLWLNGALIWTPGGPPWLTAMLGQAGVTAGVMVLLVIIAVGFATRRLKALAHHADRLGRGEDTEPLAEDGPTEIQQVVHAFNTMNVRLRRFIESRTKMLGAISHDLRTPITALRIRAEFVEDEENRERMLVTLEEMKHLTESTLTLAKEDSVSEATKNVNLTALIESIEDDLTDAGQNVSCAAEQNVQLACRPHSLKRAIRNLAENGVKYGEQARVTMTSNDDIITVLIDDDGPGIPEEKRDQVFMPFVRLEESRSKETGGVGLGLAICRSIIHSHGGDLQMDNRPEGGLRVTVRLPRNGSDLIESPDAIAKE